MCDAWLSQYRERNAARDSLQLSASHEPINHNNEGDDEQDVDDSAADLECEPEQPEHDEHDYDEPEQVWHVGPPHHFENFGCVCNCKATIVETGTPEIHLEGDGSFICLRNAGRQSARDSMYGKTSELRFARHAGYTPTFRNFARQCSQHCRTAPSSSSMSNGLRIFAKMLSF